MKFELTCTCAKLFTVNFTKWWRDTVSWWCFLVLKAKFGLTMVFQGTFPEKKSSKKEGVLQAL